MVRPDELHGANENPTDAATSEDGRELHETLFIHAWERRDPTAGELMVESSAASSEAVGVVAIPPSVMALGS